MRANLVIRSCLILFPKYDFSLRSDENNGPLVTVIACNVANIDKGTLFLNTSY